MSKIFRKILLIILLFLIIVSNISFANTSIKSTYIGNTLTQKEINEMYNFSNIYGISGQKFIDWFSNKNNYVLIEKKDNGENKIWWNSPDVQSSIVNSFAKNFDMGFKGSGYNPSETKMIIDVKGTNSPRNAMEKYGFRIPTTMYIGEKSIVTINPSGLIAPRGIIGTAVKIIKVLFGGSIIDPPKKEDFNTLTYFNNGYDSQIKMATEWFKKNWKSKFLDRYVYNQSNWGQSLHPDADKTNAGKVNGTEYTVYSIIISSGIQNMPYSNEEEIQAILTKIAEASGSEFNTVFNTIIKLATANGASPFGESNRIMPYDINSMNEKDRGSVKINDPRADRLGNIFGLPITNILLSIQNYVRIYGC